MTENNYDIVKVTANNILVMNTLFIVVVSAVWVPLVIIAFITGGFTNEFGRSTVALYMIAIIGACLLGLLSGWAGVESETKFLK